MASDRLSALLGMAVIWVGVFYGSPVWGSGNTLPRASAEALGMADANVALASSPSAQFINPAGLGADLAQRSHWEAGTLLAQANVYFSRTTAASSAAAGDFRAKTYPVIPFLAVTQPYSAHTAWGFSVESPHGLGLEWADHSFDRNLGSLGSADTAKKAEQTIVRAGPAVAWKLNERWRAGVRIFAQYVSALDENDLATVEGDGVSPGAQLGLRYHTPDFAMGLAYTSRTNTEIKGGQRDIHPAAAASGLREGEARADILLPDRLQTGVAFRLIPKLWWEFDIDWIGWSYVDELTIVQVNGAVANSGKTARHNRNTRSLRTGLRWQRQPDLTLYAGLGYDPSPVPEQDASPITSMLAKTRLGLGASRLLDNGLKFDLAYQFIRGHERTIGATDQDNTATGDTHLYEGRYQSRSQILAVTLSGNF